jgi:hypothetical protein
MKTIFMFISRPYRNAQVLSFGFPRRVAACWQTLEQPSFFPRSLQFIAQRSTLQRARGTARVTTFCSRAEPCA